MQGTAIKNWAVDDRPREKLMQKGEKALSDAELVAIVLGSGTKSKSALDLAKEMLNDSDQRFLDLSKKSLKQLCQYSGIGPTRAITLLATFELAKRFSNFTEKDPRIAIKSSKDAYNFVRLPFIGLMHEEVHLCLLNRANVPIHYMQLSKGGIHDSSVDPKLVFHHALAHKACSIILVHNHPSGNLIPSDSDKKITYSLAQIGRIMEISLQDHLIITDNGYFSFLDEGILK
jgi:DNA repair protein RadC